MGQRIRPKQYTSKDMISFDEYAISLGVSPENLANSTSAGCFSNIVEDVLNNKLRYTDSNYHIRRIAAKSLRTAGIISDKEHLGKDTININRFNYLMKIRDKVK